jgi:hypothetical protein
MKHEKVTPDLFINIQFAKEIIYIYLLFLSFVDWFWPIFFNGFQANSQNSEEHLSASSCLSICPYVHMSVCPSGCLHETTRLQLDGSLLNLESECFRQAVEKVKVSLKSDKKNAYCIWRPIYIFITSCSVFLTMRNVYVKVVEKIKRYTLWSITFFFFFFFQNRAVYEKMW